MTAYLQPCNGCFSRGQSGLVSVDHEKLIEQAGRDLKDADLPAIWETRIRHQDHVHNIAIWIEPEGEDTFLLEFYPETVERHLDSRLVDGAINEPG